MQAPRFWRPPISIYHLHIFKTMLIISSSLHSSVGRVTVFRSEGCEFKSHCCLMNLYQKLITIFLLIEEQLSMLQFFKSRTYTFHPQIVIKTFEGNGKNLSIVIKTFERTGKSLPPSIISKEDERSMSQGRISEGDKPPVQQENDY